MTLEKIITQENRKHLTVDVEPRELCQVLRAVRVDRRLRERIPVPHGRSYTFSCILVCFSLF